MKQDIKKFSNNIYQIDVFMEDKPGRMSCYYIDSSNPILIEVGPSKSFPYLISSLESLGINEVNRCYDTFTSRSCRWNRTSC